ncbi:MAG: hypothetical protein K2G40_07055 [Muribaculaceae bacterium]|nr:hypothetical protein [Muribaculaceae bacterium]
MTIEQARLLREVLFNAVTNSLKGVEFPTTICNIIDAELESTNRIIDRMGDIASDSDIARRDKLVELRTIMEGK